MVAPAQIPSDRSRVELRVYQHEPGHQHQWPEYSVTVRLRHGGSRYRGPGSNDDQRRHCRYDGVLA